MQQPQSLAEARKPISLGERFTSPLPLSRAPWHSWSKFVRMYSSFKKCCSRCSQSYLYDSFFLDGRHVFACNFRTMPFYTRAVEQIEGGGTVIWAKSDALAMCLDVPQKRPSKSSYKTNRILTSSLQRPSHVSTCVSRCCLPFLKKMKKLGPARPCFGGEAKFERCWEAFGPTLTDVCWKMRP